jgi:hypothetical protein
VFGPFGFELGGERFGRSVGDGAGQVDTPTSVAARSSL